MTKEVYSIRELMEVGYPERMLRRILNSEDFYKVGFREQRKAYFYKAKLEKYLERRTEWQY